MRPKLLLLPEYRPNLIGQLPATLRRIDAQYLHPSAVRIKNPCQHLDRSTLPSAVWPDKRQHLSLVHSKGNPSYRFDLLRLRPQNRLHTAPHSLFLSLYPKCLLQFFHTDRLHDSFLPHQSFLKSRTKKNRPVPYTYKVYLPCGSPICNPDSRIAK